METKYTPYRASKAEEVVRVIVSTLEGTFGHDFIAAIQSQFDEIYKLSFKDFSIIEHPDQFAEAIQYAFQTSSDLIMAEINRKLVELLSIDLRSSQELVESGAYGFVNLMAKLRRDVLLIED